MIRNAPFICCFGTYTKFTIRIVLQKLHDCTKTEIKLEIVFVPILYSTFTGLKFQ